MIGLLGQLLLVALVLSSFGCAAVAVARWEHRAMALRKIGALAVGLLGVVVAARVWTW